MRYFQYAHKNRRARRARYYLLSLLCCLGLLSGPAAAQTIKQAAVATAHPAATRAGIEILRQGGNAFDAAAAVTASLGVVEPHGSGLGGGGFWLLHRASDGKQIMIDGREKAPLAAHKDIYLDKDGKVIKGMSLNGPTAAGIPGTPAAIERLVKEYGRLSLKQALAPAIRQARAGFRVTEGYQKWMKFRAWCKASIKTAVSGAGGICLSIAWSNASRSGWNTTASASAPRRRLPRAALSWGRC